jgi:hypothetical protein
MKHGFNDTGVTAGICCFEVTQEDAISYVPVLGKEHQPL